MTSRPVDPTATGPSAGTPRTRTVVLIAVAAAVIAGLVGLGLGGLGGVLLSSGSAGGSDTDQDIAEGCAILERAEDQLPVSEDSLSLEEPLLFELGAAGNLFMAAGAGGADDELWASGSDLVTGMSMLDTDMINESIETLQATSCT
ncbi:hypothetical protein [Brachybacterium sacelli]|uniref:Uncharacterized protein n=1 Tax=Brachybacterium sacelli TaxID=173364 RepID=A0ABS4X3R4_9MICO|nr:hypothetical protein [Brachybacterium sacelli]MBP2383105.1 hypothetical protein [Brachybacterium sacelli]